MGGRGNGARGGENGVRGKDNHDHGEQFVVRGEENHDHGEQFVVRGKENHDRGKQFVVCGKENHLCGEENHVCGRSYKNHEPLWLLAIKHSPSLPALSEHQRSCARNSNEVTEWQSEETGPANDWRGLSHLLTKEDPTHLETKRNRLCRLRAPGDEGVLEAQKIKDVADRPGRGVAVAGVGLTVDETVLEAQEVEDVEYADACALIAIGVT